MTIATEPVGFRAWLLRQRSRDDPVGDLARDMRDDKASRARTLRGIRKRLNECGACQGAHDALDDAAIEYAALYGLPAA